VPELDFALLSDYVRVEGGIAHVIAAGVDTVNTPTRPPARISAEATASLASIWWRIWTMTANGSSATCLGSRNRTLALG
jgi:hypothetical protein